MATAHHKPPLPSANVRRMGYLKKLKTKKRKYFVLREDCGSTPARLEYYDSEKKWRSGTPPKRSIVLKTCFNINRKVDSQQKHVIALYTKDDCFAVAVESESELEQWLNALLQLQRGTTDEELLDENHRPRPIFEHVWQVIIKNKGLGSSKSILGPHRLCLTERTLSLVKMNVEVDQFDSLEFPLMSIRRCGHSDCFFFMEVGRSSVTGMGEFWMQTEDTVIAQNMHEVILNAMKSSHKDDLVPRPRTRSSSANEASKPISVHSRRQTGIHHPTISQTTAHTAVATTGVISSTTSIPAHLSIAGRERCDSMPSSGGRTRAISETQPYSQSAKGSGHLIVDSHRPRSMYTRNVSSPPPTGYPISSPGSGSYFLDSTGSSLSVDESDSSQYEILHSLPSEPSIQEETGNDSYMSMAPGESHDDWYISHPLGTIRSADEEEEGYMDMNPAASHFSLPSVSLRSESPLPIPLSSSSPYSTASHTRTSSMCSTGSLSGAGNPQHPSWLSIGVAGSHSASPSGSSPSPSRNDGHRDPSPLVTPQRGLRSDYVEMVSPGSDNLTTRPASDGYALMSPLGASYPDIGSIKSQSSAKNLTAGSEKLTRRKKSEGELPDGYVPMAAFGEAFHLKLNSHSPVEDEGYLDMTPLSQSLPRSSGGDSSRRSSITSGTPSTDLRFSEFQLEKVRSYFTPSEDDEDISSSGGHSSSEMGSGSTAFGQNSSNRGRFTLNASNERIVRAYSFGSQVEGLRKKGCAGRGGTLSSGHNANEGMDSSSARIRAFSVGSKVGLKFGTRLAGNRNPNPSDPNASTQPSASDNTHTTSKGTKSSSAPMLGNLPLANSWGSPNFKALASAISQTSECGSIASGRSSNHSEDLMEMDFPAPRLRTSSNSSTATGPAMVSPTSASSAHRPRSNSRSSNSSQSPVLSHVPMHHSGGSGGRNVKMDMLQSIGERSLGGNSLRSSMMEDPLSNESYSSPGAIISPKKSESQIDDYAEMNPSKGSGDDSYAVMSPLARKEIPRGSLKPESDRGTKQPSPVKSPENPDYLDMKPGTTSPDSERLRFGPAPPPKDQQRSLSSRIFGSVRSSKKKTAEKKVPLTVDTSLHSVGWKDSKREGDTSPSSGEYVSIQYSSDVRKSPPVTTFSASALLVSSITTTASSFPQHEYSNLVYGGKTGFSFHGFGGDSKASTKLDTRPLSIQTNTDTLTTTPHLEIGQLLLKTQDESRIQETDYASMEIPHSPVLFKLGETSEKSESEGPLKAWLSQLKRVASSKSLEGDKRRLAPSLSVSSLPDKNQDSAYLEMRVKGKPTDLKKTSSLERRRILRKGSLTQGSSPKRIHQTLSSSDMTRPVSVYENLTFTGSSEQSRCHSDNHLPSETRLNYASLDLSPSPCHEGDKSPRYIRRNHPSGGGSSAGSENDLPCQYAKIDFKKNDRHFSGKSGLP